MASSAPREGPRGRKPRQQTKPPGAKMRAYRERMRAAGMRQVQIWVPDSSSPSFRREVRRQSRLVSREASEGEVLRDIETVADLDGWE